MEGIIQRAHIPISIQGNVFKIITRGCTGTISRIYSDVSYASKLLIKDQPKISPSL